MERLIKYARVCDECAKGMNDGFVISGGEQYFCSKECLHQNYTEEEFTAMATEDSDTYWTQWETNFDDEDDFVLGDENGMILKVSEAKEYKNKVTKAEFLRWYFSGSDDVNNFGRKCLDMLLATGTISYTAEMLFNECGYIPKYICEDYEDAEGVDYDPTEVELINK